MNPHLNQVQDPKFTFRPIDYKYEVQSCVAAVYHAPSLIILLLWSQERFKLGRIEEVA